MPIESSRHEVGVHQDILSGTKPGDPKATGSGHDLLDEIGARFGIDVNKSRLGDC